MSAENKAAARKYRIWADPNIPFGLAIAVIIFYAVYTLREGLLYGPESCIYLAASFIILRYARLGWWKLLRGLVFCLIFLGFGVRLAGLEIYPSSAMDPYVFPALFILSLWLYLT